MPDQRCKSNFFFDFPLELQYQIFALAARADFKGRTAIALCLASRYIYGWIKPIIYERIILRTEDQAKLVLPVLQSLDPQFIADTVKIVCLPEQSDITIQVLQLCTKAEALTLADCFEYDTLKDYRPARLALFEPDFAQYDFPPESSPFELPFFSRVTHLQLFDLLLDLPYELLPHLTHLMLFVAEGGDMWESQNPAAIKKIVEKCAAIDVFLILFGEDFGETEMVMLEVKAVIESPRLILAEFTKWTGWTDDDIDDPEAVISLLDGTSIWEKGFEVALPRETGSQPKKEQIAIYSWF